MNFLKSFSKIPVFKSFSTCKNHTNVINSRFSTSVNKELDENYTKESETKFSKKKKRYDELHNNQEGLFKVTAYATAEDFQLEKIQKKLQNEKFFKLKELPEDAPNVLHVEYSPLLASSQATSFKNMFIFREGSIVFWNFKTDEKIYVLNMVRPFQNDSYDRLMVLDQIETLEYKFTENPSRLVQGDIQLKTPSSSTPQSLPLELYAFSNAIALSVKLAIWESCLDKFAPSIEFLLEDLKSGRSLRISENQVLKKTGELFTLSHRINLSSDLMAIPDFYWDREHLEKIYHSTYLHLNVPRRTKIMNSKLSQCVDFMELLRDHLKDKHHTRLELMIIFLILIEVVFGSYHFYDRYYKEKIPST